MRRIFVSVVVGLGCFGVGHAASPVSPTGELNPSTRLPGPSLAFVRSNCLDCHHGDSAEAGFDVASLKDDLADAATMDHWIKVFDRVDAGEMPPADAGEPDSDEKSDFLATTGQQITSVQADQHRQFGRVRGRRLSNVQLERTLQDLLYIDVPLSKLMPPEPRTHGFVHLADAQAMSHFQLQAHLRVVDAALDAAFDRAMRPEKDWSIQYGPQEIANKPKGRRNREPEMRQGLAVTWSCGLIFYGRIASTRVEEDGWYRVTFTASAVKPPEDKNVWCSVRSGECVSSAPLLDWIGSFEATATPKTVTVDAWLPAGHMLEIRPADTTLAKIKAAGGQVGLGEGESQNAPGVALHDLSMRRIRPGGELWQARQRLFGNLPREWDAEQKRSIPVIGSQSIGEQIVALENCLVDFASLAYRRPASIHDIRSTVDMAADMLRGGESFVDALRAGYRTILCSPRFLYLIEPADDRGRLDDWAVATRLSYFLCGGPPDESLRRDAAAGRLSTPDRLKTHVDRLLATNRGRQFIAQFAAQWLDLVDIDFTEPDRRLFPTFDIVVQDAMLKETHAFLQKQLDENRPIAEMFAADYTFLNERLARYYGIEGVQGDALQQVTIGPESHRGGLLAQGAILKVTANGNDTSPILRGIWVSERLLGVEIPEPPANVPAVEPDIRGAATIRELLAKHQADDSCAGCHRKIDPPGFALENFDAGGLWRDRYTQLVGKKYKPGPIVDPGFIMPDGSTFDSFAGFRQWVADRPEQLAANLTQQLLVYATGSPIQFADRSAIQTMVQNTQSDDYGVRSLLHQVVTSDPFLNK